MFGSSKSRILSALDREIARAKRFRNFIGILLLDVAETTPRGIHEHLPGITVNVQHFRSLLREYDVVIKAKLRRYTVILPQLDASESAHLVKDRILFTSRLQEWGPVNVGIAIYPEHGQSSRALLKAAELDLEAHLQPEETDNSGH
ncbi:MAG: hypothetical protein NTW14_04370 [bacterium]|nr:hypothetical protein [bacterium]